MQQNVVGLVRTDADVCAADDPRSGPVPGAMVGDDGREPLAYRRIRANAARQRSAGYRSRPANPDRAETTCEIRAARWRGRGKLTSRSFGMQVSASIIATSCLSS